MMETSSSERYTKKSQERQKRRTEKNREGFVIRRLTLVEMSMHGNDLISGVSPSTNWQRQSQ